MKKIFTLIVCAAVTFASLCGCGKTEGSIAVSDNFTFGRDMTLYQLYCDKVVLGELDGETEIDFESLAEYTADNIKEMLAYCEVAKAAGFSPDEGMIYRANETISYISLAADNAGMSTEEYIGETFGEDITLDAIRLCVEMYIMCEGYENSVLEDSGIGDGEAEAYADEHYADFLSYDFLRYSTTSEALSTALAAAKTPDEFAAAVLEAVPALLRTDSDKSGIPDILESTAVVSSDGAAGEYFASSDRAVCDTYTEKTDGGYTVTMALTLPHRLETPTWNFRMVLITDSRSEDPYDTVKSLHEQWLEKESGEDGIAALAARYSDDPTAYSGGLFSGATHSDMPSEAVEEWVCDSARVPGDAAALEDADGNGCLVYFIGNGDPLWLYNAKRALAKERLDAEVDAAEEKVSVDKDAILSLIK